MSGKKFGAIFLFAGLFAQAQDFKDLEKKVVDFSLPNGLRFVVVERHDNPTIAFRTHVAAGSVNDPAGASGLAQMFERLAYKGTETIGSRDGAAEKKALDALEEANDRLAAERNKGSRASDSKIISLELEVQKAHGQAQSFIIPNEFRRIFEENGATALAAATAPDSTQFQCVMPSNRAELWFLLESQRLLRPSFRDFYLERDAAVEEIRKRTESNTAARLYGALAAAAFTAHPYRNPPVGWASDILTLRLADARQFFERYYAPSNITIAIVGDVSGAEARRLAEKYFGPIPARPLPAPIHTEDPPQTGPRTVVLESATQPLLAVGYKRPDEFDRDDAAFDVLQMLLTGSRGSWLQQDLVENRRIAAGVQAQAAFPGGRYANLFTLAVSVAPGHSPEENEAAISIVLARLQTEPVDPATLARAKAQARANVLRRLNDNAGIAQLLAGFAADHGDWRKLFASLGAYSKVSAAQVQIAALKYFVPARRTSVYLTPPTPVAVQGKGDVN